MSYDVIKEIEFQEDKVFLTSCSSHDEPGHFNRWECEYFSKMLQEKGKDAVMQAIAGNVWDRTYIIQKGSEFCNAMDKASRKLLQSKTLSLFLDTDTAAKYISNVAQYLMGDKDHRPQIDDLDSLRHNSAAVLDICKRNPRAFNLAGDEIKNDRLLARQFIFTCADRATFEFPENFANVDTPHI